MSSPNLLTTHQYLTETIDLIGEEQYHKENHRLITKPLEADILMPTQHVIEASLAIPIDEDTESGAVRITGPRRMDVSLWTPPLPKRAEWVLNSKSRAMPDKVHEQLCLAEASFTFTSRRLDSVNGFLWADGRALGLDESRTFSARKDNLLLTKLAALGHERPFGIRKAADFVMALSLETGASSVSQQWRLNFQSKAREIQRQTGKHVPRSLLRAPFVDVSRHATIPLNPYDIAATKTTTNIDDFYPDTGERVITKYIQTQYDGFCPVEQNDVELYSVLTDDGEETGTSFGIRALQHILGSNEDHYVVASTPEEVRDMVTPLIRAMTNLRRYYTAALKDAA